MPAVEVASDPIYMNPTEQNGGPPTEPGVSVASSQWFSHKVRAQMSEQPASCARRTCSCATALRSSHQGVRSAS
eukprot:6205095-Pleurochrysis_carterae.AAC.2